MLHREDLREQHALGEEIANAITNTPLGETIDETELDDELAEMEQEQLDDKMLKTGTVPVSDDIHRLPAAVNGERTYSHIHTIPGVFILGGKTWKLTHHTVKNKQPARQEEDDEEEELRKLQAEMAM